MQCKRCGKKINKNEKYVLIRTHFENQKEVDDYFHWQCWIDEFKNAVKKKLEQVKSNVMENARSIVGNLIRN